MHGEGENPTVPETASLMDVLETITRSSPRQRVLWTAAERYADHHGRRHQARGSR